MHVELESDEYWDWVKAVCDDPFELASVYTRPIFEVFDLHYAMCEDEIEHIGDCLCRID